MKHFLAVSAILALAACLPPVEPPPANSDPDPVFRTSAHPFVRPVAAGVRVTALATVGDILPGSREALAPVPDGIGAWGGGNVMHLMLNHELSGVRTADGGIAFEYARVSRMDIDVARRGVLAHQYVIDGSEGYEVLCAAEWFGADVGFSTGYFFTGEERDFTGRQLAIDASGTVREMPWMGHYAHESQIVVPGFDAHTVLLNFDDTSAGEERDGRGLSELYMYVGPDEDAVMSGGGQLYVFAPREGHSGNVGDLVSGTDVVGRWKPIPEAIARNPDGTVLQSYVDSIGVFEFVRLEDGWYDKRPGHGPGAMFFDTGRDERVLNGARTGPADPWGSLYYLLFDRADPIGPTRLTLMARSAGPGSGWASPDNGDMLPDGTIMLQEDRSNTPWEKPPGIYRLRMIGPRSVDEGELIAEVTDPDCPDGPTCSTSQVNWETSGITDVSEFFGPGYWLVTVQAHSKPVPSLGLANQGGQLLLLEIDE